MWDAANQYVKAYVIFAQALIGQLITLFLLFFVFWKASFKTFGIKPVHSLISTNKFKICNIYFTEPLSWDNI